MRKIYFLVLGLIFISGVKAQIVNIPDANFKARLLTYSYNDDSGNHVLNANNDGEIQVSEAQSITFLSVSGEYITSLEGVSSFSNLTWLDCSENLLTSLDVTGLLKLESLIFSNNKFPSFDAIKGIESIQNLTLLECSANQFDSLDLTFLKGLTILRCYNNQLNSLDVSSLVNLEEFNCNNNQLTALNINNCINLKSLSCSFNQLTTLDVSDNVNLNSIRFNDNQLTSLDFSTNTDGFKDEYDGMMVDFIVNNNQLTSIIFPKFYKAFAVDLSNNLLETIDIPSGTFDQFNCGNNPNLSSAFLKNITLKMAGQMEYYSSVFQNCPNLKYICADDSQVGFIEFDLGFLYPNLNVNSYCSFVPGGTYYTIKGNTRLDSNTNGCDANDAYYPNLNFSITDGTITGSLVSNATGSYSIPVQAGTHTITPLLENPSYFTVSPEAVTVTFPTDSNSFTQDFCIIPNNVHPDVEVTLLPVLRARPGFDASYKISYKNKGTNTQSGSVHFAFDDAVLDFVSASPAVTTQSTDNLSWNYSDLKPFETREIEVTFNVNSPMETPAVNNNDILSYTATITSTQTDETPVDNSFALNQTVVGSFDPNDKTCLEGATIPPSAVGKYVHYLIRFENKGTAEAQNVVVKDMIDTEKFDVSSLVVTQGSHPFVTRISETNKVEFILENINLPFDDATNDGYVAFKIKTNPSLVVGDSFSNTASIYFDYNFPIVTNTATTSVLQSLGTNDFEFDSYFSIYPNPAKNSLNMDTKKQIKVSSISIYNTLGQQILVIPNAQYTKQVDISNLKTGNYFIKLTSDKGSTIGKFIKS